ncbi:MAG: DUF3343 domain-containing protein [Clostridia bacterium]|nr:DUF3343 domain-containing protein [Clostridia bacterium]
MKTQTAALKGKRALFRRGINATVVSLDASLTQNGCAYGLSFFCDDAETAEKVLAEHGVGYGMVIGR